VKARAEMSTPFITRVRLKIKKVTRVLAETPAEREFRRVWPVVDSIEGWLPLSEAKWLFSVAHSLPKHANIVEIGSYKGRSTCCLALGCRGSERRVFAVDSFDGGPDLPKADSLPSFLQNLESCGLTNYVEAIVGLSGHVAKSWSKPIHFLFVDGSHQYEDVKADFAAFFPHVAPGGMVAFHDVINEGFPGVLRAWRESVEHQLVDVGYHGSLGYGRKAGRS
jgi:predicted O-methyltransferase YrrM